MTDPRSEQAYREAAERRAEQFAREARQVDGQTRAAAFPLGAARRISTRDQAGKSQLRAQLQERDGKQFYVLEGYYTVYERAYEMWDWAGPYNEIVSAGAGQKTTAAQPDVVYLINHAGLALARTTAGTLDLWSDETGGGNRAWLNPQRPDVQTLAASVEDQITTEQSFAFMIEAGQWSPDYTEFRINEYNIDRGDVSAVNYGANPYTSVAARQREVMEALDHLPAGAARAALDRLNHREDLSAEPRPAEIAPVEKRTGSGLSLVSLELWLNDQAS